MFWKDIDWLQKETGAFKANSIDPVMEALSIGSDEICFSIFVYNIQPDIGIDYENGNSWLE